MKKLLLLSTLFFLYLATPLCGQSSRYDATEQSKRLARKNNHITKSYKGEVVKILYRSANTYGGVLNGFIFRRPNGKLLQVSVPTYFGSEVAPLLKANEKIEITVTGDELLLEEVFSKRLSMKKIEVQLQEKISGLANIQKIRTTKGLFSITNAKGRNDFRTLFLNKSEPVLNVKVSKRIRLRGKEGILELENGDSLIFNRIDDLEEIWNQNSVSYLRPKRNSALSYQNPNVYNMNPVLSSILYTYIRGKELKGTPGSRYNPTHSFLKSVDAKFVELVNDDAGFVNGMAVMNNKSKLDTFWFERTNAKAFHALIKQGKEENIRLYFHELLNMNLVYAVGLNGKTVTGEDKSFHGFVGTKEEYFPEKITFKGKVSEIQYLPENRFNSVGEKLITPFQNLILEDSIFIRVNTVVALSIAKQIEKGKEISFDGWQRKEAPTQINQKGYTFMVPHRITIDGVTFTNHSIMSTTL